MIIEKDSQIANQNEPVVQTNVEELEPKVAPIVRLNHNETLVLDLED